MSRLYHHQAPLLNAALQPAASGGVTSVRAVGIGGRERSDRQIHRTGRTVSHHLSARRAKSGEGQLLGLGAGCVPAHHGGAMSDRGTCTMWWLLLLGACSPHERDANLVTVVDSAGVEIVVIEGDRREHKSWDLTGNPALELGTQSDAGPESFYRVTALALDDRRVYVANMGTDELRIFDRSGRYVRHMGRSGFGPGEFRRLAMVEVLGPDALLTYSGGTDRYILFDTAGAVRREFRTLEGIGGLAWPVAILGDSQIVVAEGAAISQLRQSGLIHDSATLSVFAMGGSRVRDVTRIPLFDRTVTRVGDRISVGSPVFSAMTLMGASNGLICYTLAVAYEFRCVDTAGVLKRIVRWARSPQPVTAQDVEAYNRAELEKAGPDRRAAASQMLETQIFATDFPAFSRMLTDAGGGIWLEEFPRQGEQQSLWHVFQDGRTYAGSVRMPPRFRLLFVSQDAIAGVWRDEMDAEYVRIYVR